MASQAQVEANRRNAQRSTGPRSERGKAAVARNAITHGFFCRHLVLPGERQAELEALRQSVARRLRPIDAVEAIYVERFVVAAWKLRRVLAGEARTYGRAREMYPAIRGADDYAAIMADHVVHQQKLASTLERAMDKALAELARLRKSRDEDADEEAPPAASWFDENKANPAPASDSLGDRADDAPAPDPQRNGAGHAAASHPDAGEADPGSASDPDRKHEEVGPSAEVPVAPCAARDGDGESEADRTRAGGGPGEGLTGSRRGIGGARGSDLPAVGRGE